MGHASRDQVFPESSALWHAEEMASSIRAHGGYYGKICLRLTLSYLAPRDSLKSQLCVCCASDKRGPFVVPSGFCTGAERGEIDRAFIAQGRERCAFGEGLNLNLSLGNARR